jgi:hypothetical protein
METPQKKLIITTGDVSDVDGFIALAQYARTGADVMFIMNYPAYLRDDYVTNVPDDITETTYKEQIAGDDYGKGKTGLGYTYNSYALIKQNDKTDNYIGTRIDSIDKDKSLKEKIQLLNNTIKLELTILAYKMCKKVWDESHTTGKLYFAIGGINAVNPFSANSIKIEQSVYTDLTEETISTFFNEDHTSIPNCGEVFTYDDSGIETVDINTNIIMTEYESIYLDFNGSMAFLDDTWFNLLTAVADKLKGVFIMGGVYADKPPDTMSAIPKALNRFSCCTMNQLYHPANTAKFFGFLNEHPEIPTFIVTNNTVNALVPQIGLTSFKKKEDINPTDTLETAKKNLTTFINSNLGGTNTELINFCVQYYNSDYGPPLKPFDFFTALVLCDFLDSNIGEHASKSIYYDSKYGITLLYEEGKTAKEVIDLFITQLKTKKEKNKWAEKGFEEEIDTLNGIDSLTELKVIDVDSEQFNNDKNDKTRIIFTLGKKIGGKNKTKRVKKVKKTRHHKRTSKKTSKKRKSHRKPNKKPNQKTITL